MITACIQSVSDCLNGGEYPCTNAAENTANGYITVYCGCGGLPTETIFDSDIEKFKMATNFLNSFATNEKLIQWDIKKMSKKELF